MTIQEIKQSIEQALAEGKRPTPPLSIENNFKGCCLLGIIATSPRPTPQEVTGTTDGAYVFAHGIAGYWDGFAPSKHCLPEYLEGFNYARSIAERLGFVK